MVFNFGLDRIFYLFIRILFNLLLRNGKVVRFFFPIQNRPNVHLAAPKSPNEIRPLSVSFVVLWVVFPY